MSAEIRKYQYFIAIAEEKSITQAAKRLYISQPALTQYLHNLETEMGVKLFERFGSQYLPTAAGQIYLKGAYAISAIDRETQNQINETKSCDLITFTIALSHSQNVHRIHYLFLKMKEKFPNIRFHVLERTSEDCPDTIASGMAEIGIVSQPCSLRQLNCVPLWEDYPLLVTNRRNSLDAFAVEDSGFPRVRLQDVADRTFISMTQSSHAWQACDKLFRKYGIKPNIVFDCPFVSSLLKILQNTDYAAIVPMGLLDESPEFSYYRIDEAECWQVMALYRNSMQLMKQHEYFLKIMREAPLLGR